jgi:membrane associated rhomboid family serine protease
MEKLFSHLDNEQADLCVLVLSASGIACTPRQDEDGWAIWVDADKHTAAIEKLGQYFRENPEKPTPTALPPLGSHKTMTGIGAALLLAIFHGVATFHGVTNTIVEKFGAISNRILDGEVYRTVTALLLHSGPGHLMGNMAGIALFGTAVCGVTRPGVGWFLVLMTGAIGNLANAALQSPGHRSIGASTAVFGAIGLLSAFQFWNKYRRPGHRLKAWLPLAGGLALLGFLGTAGARTDLMAHLFGLLAGLLLGTLYSFFILHPLPEKHQRVAWCLTAGLLILAWFQGKAI